MRTLLFSVCIAYLIMILAACGPADRVEMTDTLERSEYRPPDKPNATSAERFILAAPPVPTESPTQNAQTSSNGSQFHYDVPEGWTEVAVSQFRSINFTLGPNSEIECYVSILPGGGGGVAVNLNRWRGQLGLDDYTPDEVRGLPTVPIMGINAVLVNFSGTFTSMQGQVNEGYHLLGAILEMSDNLVTIKMVGPSELVKGELNSFAQFVDSLHDGTGHSHDASPAAAAPAAAPPEPMEPLTSGHGFSWEIPDDWTFVNHPSSMRLVTFAV